jgi:hypothetical protein
MLPKELLVVRRRKGCIRPCYLEDTLLAEELIRLFKQYEGMKYKELLRKQSELEGSNFKVVRGLSTLLERRCRFMSSSGLPGREVRSFLFEKGFVVTLEEREKLLAEACRHFNATEQEIEEAFFSDLQEEQLLSEFNPLTPEDLVKKYNLSLTQTLLFDSLEFTFKVEENYQHIFRQIKYLGLMYEINDGVRVTGPASLFKKNRRYGGSLAKLLPIIMGGGRWKIHAKIESQAGGEPKVFDFELSSQDKVPLPVSKGSLSHFDSEVEQRFYNDFVSLNLGWAIKREPDIVKAGNYVIIPDFGFYKNKLMHYLEIVGFWTPEYLKKKISKLKEAEAAITVAVNENLNCKKEDFQGDVLFYKDRIPLTPIVKILRDIEERQVEEELQEIGEIKINQDKVSMDEIARELNISPAALKKITIPSYHIIGDQIVSESYLGKIKMEIGSNQKYEEVEEILRKYDLSTLALDHMGLKVVWSGLRPIKVVEKNQKQMLV